MNFMSPNLNDSTFKVHLMRSNQLTFFLYGSVNCEYSFIIIARPFDPM